MSAVPRYLKHLPTPLRVLLRPWLIVALALHGAVLFLPLLPDEPAPEPAPELISLTELPPTAAPPPVPPSPVPSPPRKLPPVAPPVALIVPSQQPASIPAPPPVALQPAPASPIAPVVSPSATPTVQPSPIASPSPSPEPSPSVPAYLVDFPHVATAAVCDQVEQCWRSPDSQWRGLARTLEADLATQGYALNEMPLDDETGRRVYEVSRGNEVVYYLNVISTLEGTVYRVTEEPLTPAEMDAIAGF